MRDEPEAAALPNNSAIEVLESVADPNLPETFTVRDQHSANWVVRRIIECRSYADRVTEWAATEMRRAEREEQFFWFRYGTQLEKWAAAEIQKFNGRRKSVAVPAGTLGFRREPARLVVIDDNRLLVWCRSHLPQALKVSVEAGGDDAQQLLRWQQSHCPGTRCTEQVVKNVLQDHFRSAGEIPDGADRVAGGEKFYVK